MDPDGLWSRPDLHPSPQRHSTGSLPATAVVSSRAISAAHPLRPPRRWPAPWPSRVAGVPCTACASRPSARVHRPFRRTRTRCYVHSPTASRFWSTWAPAHPRPCQRRSSCTRLIPLRRSHRRGGSPQLRSTRVQIIDGSVCWLYRGAGASLSSQVPAGCVARTVLALRHVAAVMPGTATFVTMGIFICRGCLSGSVFCGGDN